MVLKSTHLPLPGETVLGGSFSTHPGGKGANQAVAAARLNGEVTLIARLGDDMFGRQAIKGFETHNIDTRFMSIDPDVPSGVALIMVDEKGENCISVALGANDALKPEHVKHADNVLKECAFVLMQLETPLQVVEYVGKLANEYGFRFVLNPAPAKHLSDELLASLYMITPNTIEAELLSGVKVIDESSARVAAQIIKAKGVSIVVITMGSQGAFVLSDGMDELIPCPEVEVVDTTAAGDTFNGALVVALSEGQDLRQAIKFANQAAAYSVGILGAQSSVPSRQDVESLNEKN